MNKRIAIIGMECLYPEANGYKELWHNILAGRKAFRKMPEERLNSNYFSDNQDAIYQNQAAVISDYNFDRVKFKIPKETYLSTDITHWIALDIASQAINDAKLEIDDALRSSTGVFIGNTLTGEMTRSNLLRQRWPYVYSTIRHELEGQKWDAQEVTDFLNRIEKRYKAAFPVMQEDSLAGGLSNTIAGRICNYYDFNGGGYTVDGACSSSLLAITTACKAIESGEITMALAGGVDISLDPFELVGFSRAGALAKEKMYVFSKKSNGFLPGEGCGFVVLMDADIAEKKGLSIYAFMNGYGISSDGKGGITRPKASMQEKAIRKAYPNDSMSFLKYIETHGTGTRIGDKTELTALDSLTQPLSDVVYIGAIKELIGHTKAAAGIAGFIKTVLVAMQSKIPAQHGHYDSHDILSSSKNLRIPLEMVDIKDKNIICGVSAFGFGGINVHISIQNNPKNKTKIISETIPSYQEGELFLFSSSNIDDLVFQVSEILSFAEKLSIGELSDLSNVLFKKLKENVTKRLAIVASSPGELSLRLKKSLDIITNASKKSEGVFFESEKLPVKIGYLFPGQGTGHAVSSHLYKNRFFEIEGILKTFDIENGHIQLDNTALTQPFIVRNTAIALKLLSVFGVQADLAIGHSLGELSALYWSGALDLTTLKELSLKRGEFMNDFGNQNGRMCSISADKLTVTNILNGYDVVIACQNSNKQTIVSGSDTELKKVENALLNTDIPFASLKVKRAFHSPLMRSGKLPFKHYIDTLTYNTIKTKILSPTTLGRLSTTKDINKLLLDQFDNPVQFLEIFEKGDKDVDLWIEIGSGKTLTNIAKSITRTPVTSIDISNNMDGLLEVVGILYTKGVPINLEKLFNKRYVKKMYFPWNPMFISNPCEKTTNFLYSPNPEMIKTSLSEEHAIAINTSSSTIDVLKQIIAKRTKLPLEAIENDGRMLDDLHLNSIVVGDIIAELSHTLGYTITGTPIEYANASLSEIVHVFDSNSTDRNTIEQSIQPRYHWVEAFNIEWFKESLFTTTLLNDEDNLWISIDSKLNIKLPGYGCIISLIGCNELQVIKKLELLIKYMNRELPEKLIIIQDKSLASGWSKSLYLEYPQIDILLITANQLQDILPKLKEEVQNLSGLHEVSYLNNNHREIALMKPVSSVSLNDEKIKHTDIVLVTGGAKGITAECALALAKKKNNVTIIIGRSPKEHKEVQRNLDRFDQAGLIYHYYECDVISSEDLLAIKKNINEKYGKITVILHGAGTNTPTPIINFNHNDLKKTLEPKHIGLKNLLQCYQESVEQVITFGSIIAHTGMRGNADYALANEWMVNTLKNWANTSKKRWLNIAWSVWRGTGMGDHLGVLEQLRIQGIDPISIESGVEKFLELVLSNAKENLIVSGRYGRNKTIKSWQPKISNFRFIETPILSYPNKEVVLEFTLSTATDLYLEDHKIDDVIVYPTVMSLEIMTQTVAFLQGKVVEQLNFSSLELIEPILISEQDLLLRVNAYRQDNTIKLFLTNTNKLETIYVKAEFNIDKKHNAKVLLLPEFNIPKIDIEGDLYGTLLFHTGRFKCINKYYHLSPFEAVASVNIKSVKWFSSNKNQSVLTLHPEINDAMLHVVQACVPHFTLLPTSIDRIYIDTKTLQSSNEELLIHAKENYRDNDVFNYDVTLVTFTGDVLSQYLSVSYKIVKGGRQQVKALSDTTLALSLNRMLSEEKMQGLTLEINKATPEQTYRPDGKPLLISSDNFISKSNLENIHLTVQANIAVGCDLEIISDRSEKNWYTLLKEKDIELATALNEDFNTACTRLWGVRESLRKMEILLPIKLTSRVNDQPNSIEFIGDGFRTFSWKTRHKDIASEIIITVCKKVSKDTKLFKHSFTVDFEETNLVGNVYFSNYTKWQGKCREAFLRQNVMKITNEKGEKEPITSLLSDGRLALITCSTECKFLKELSAFDTVNMYIALDDLINNRIFMNFNYYRETEDGEELVAKGKQEVACMERTNEGIKTYREGIPKELKNALLQYI
ncbi:type I polyketide synthase [Changchengzhania lutea]|uniref:type I polyketide synthase n=1 Tax=Changchengzhania lutea TaxID=2049305 RepID=UPI00115EE229|nr:type I polyketide synthase [Changchengzhania lutea]